MELFIQSLRRFMVLVKSLKIKNQEHLKATLVDLLRYIILGFKQMKKRHRSMHFPLTQSDLKLLWFSCLQILAVKNNNIFQKHVFKWINQRKLSVKADNSKLLKDILQQANAL